MPFFKSTFAKILDARGITVEEAAKAAGMSLAKLRSTLDGDNIPTKLQIQKLSMKLAVPPYAFFAAEFTVPPSPIMDFRAAKPDIMKYGKDSGRFEYIIKFRDFLAELYKRMDLDAPDKIYSIDVDGNPEQFAKAVEKLLHLDDLRKEATDKREFFSKFRRQVEALGIYVVQDHHLTAKIDGFSIYHENFSSNLIYINSLKRNQAAKSFTLAHELAHIFGKRSAISDNYHFDNEVESFANEFAAALLIPRDELLAEIDTRKYIFANYEVTVSHAEKLSMIFKCSVSAMLVRLQRLGYSKPEYTSRFLSGFGRASFPDTEKPQLFGSKDGPKPGVIDTAFIGERAASLLVTALSSKVTTPLEVFQHTGFSKKRIEGLIEHIANIRMQAES